MDRVSLASLGKEFSTFIPFLSVALANEIAKIARQQR